MKVKYRLFGKRPRSKVMVQLAVSQTYGRIVTSRNREADIGYYRNLTVTDGDGNYTRKK